MRRKTTRFGALAPLSALLLATGLTLGGAGAALAQKGQPVEDDIVVTPAMEERLSAWLTGFRRDALAEGITSSTFNRAFQGISLDVKVLELNQKQPEFVRPIWGYLGSALSDKRKADGAEQLRANRKLFDRLEERYGVEREVLAAIWGLETHYGTFMGSRSVIRSLTTLAFEGRRADFGRTQLIAALKIIQSGDITPKAMNGSWAGAMGHTQFIPTSYLAYAVDFTGDGRRDIWSDDPTDALASAAAYLKRSGWTYGQPWGLEVRLPAGFNTGLAGRGTSRSTASWASLGVRDVRGNTVPDHGPASIILPSGASGPAFMTFRNFTVITRYNNSEKYVIGVGHLSDRIVGGSPIKGNFPPDAQGMTLDDRKELQERLTRAGYDTGGADGVIGSKTVAAIRGYQSANGLLVDGQPSLDLLKRLRS